MDRYAPSSREAMEANRVPVLMRRRPTPLVDTLLDLEHQFAVFLVANLPAVVVVAAAAAAVDTVAVARVDIDVHNSFRLTEDIHPHFHL